MRQLELTHNKHLFVPIGISGCGKTGWSHTNFNPHEVKGNDDFRELLAGTTFYTRNLDRAATEMTHTWVDLQMRNGVTVVVDNLNLKGKYRRNLIDMAGKYGYTVHYVVMEDSRELNLCLQRNAARERNLPDEVIISQHEYFNGRMDREVLARDADHVHHHSSADPLGVVRVPARAEATPSGAVLVGDLHGQFHKLRKFLLKYGIVVTADATVLSVTDAPMMVFLGDYVDRGPQPVEVVSTIKQLVEKGHAFAIRGNHDETLGNALRKVTPKGYASSTQETWQLFHDQCTPQEILHYSDWLLNLPLTGVVSVSDVEFAVSHAGIKYLHGQQHYTWAFPSGYEKDIVIRGYMDGTTETREGLPGKEFRSILHPSMCFDNASEDAPMQLFGHFNQSLKLEGVWQVPFVHGRTICLESHIENSDEFDVGYIHIH